MLLKAVLFVIVYVFEGAKAFFALMSRSQKWAGRRNRFVVARGVVVIGGGRAQFLVLFE